MKRLWSRVRVLDATVRSQYGDGFTRYGKAVWYSLLRPSRFMVLAGRTDAATSLSEAAEFRFVSPAELAQIREGQIWPREFHIDQIRRTSGCCVGFVEGVPAYVHWIFEPGDPSRFLRLHEGTAEINYILTMPAFRGRGLCPAAMEFTRRQLRNRGISTIYAVVHEANVASLKALRRAGLREIGIVTTIGRVHRKFEARPLGPEPSKSAQDPH